MELQRVGVIGAGVIGVGVIQNLAQTGHDVVAVDTSDEARATAERSVRRAVRLHHVMAGEGPRLDIDPVMARIRFDPDLESLADRQFIIENVTEDWSIKRPIYQRLDAMCGPSTVFAANTSIIPIARFAAATGRPEKVIGMHFMNPVPLKPVVEVIRSAETSQGTIDAATRLLAQMGKSAIWVNDSPGFVSNRVLMLTINEAAKLVDEGVAGPEAVDAIFKDCFGHAMGPLATADLIGLDTVVHSLEGLEEEFESSRFAPAQGLLDLVRSGRLGRKTGDGFHTYTTTHAGATP